MSVLLVITMLVVAVVLMLMLVSVFATVSPCFTTSGIVFAETYPGKMSILSALVAFSGLCRAVCLAPRVISTISLALPI